MSDLIQKLDALKEENKHLRETLEKARLAILRSRTDLGEVNKILQELQDQ